MREPRRAFPWVLSPCPYRGVRVAHERHKKGVPARGADTPSSEGKGTPMKSDPEDRNIIIRLTFFVNKGLLTRIS